MVHTWFLVTFKICEMSIVPSASITNMDNFNGCPPWCPLVSALVSALMSTHIPTRMWLKDYSEV